MVYRTSALSSTLTSRHQNAREFSCCPDVPAPGDAADSEDSELSALTSEAALPATYPVGLGLASVPSQAVVSTVKLPFRS